MRVPVLLGVAERDKHRPRSLRLVIVSSRVARRNPERALGDLHDRSLEWFPTTEAVEEPAAAHARGGVVEDVDGAPESKLLAKEREAEALQRAQAKGSRTVDDDELVRLIRG